MKYMVVIEKVDENFSAYAPDLPGCIATGDPREEVVTLMKEAVECHIAEMQDAGEAVPTPTTDIEFVDVSAA